jgi:hypothetical protein
MGNEIENHREKSGITRRKFLERTFSYLGPEETLVSWYPGREEFEGKTIREIEDPCATHGPLSRPFPFLSPLNR